MKNSTHDITHDGPSRSMSARSTALWAAVFFSLLASSAHAWDHPGHMMTAAIAFSEIERTRPDLIERIGLLLLTHPDPTPFWMAAGDAKGKERIRRMFIEAARWAIVVKDAPPEVKAAAEARKGEPAGQALEALALNFAVLSNPEAVPAERARSLCWALHVMGDIHQPMHVSDLFSKDFPAGNAAATLSYVADPLGETTIPLHLLWDSNDLRKTSLDEIDRRAREFLEKYPRSSFPQLAAAGPSFSFRDWARESHQTAVDWAYEIQTVSDPNKDQDADRLVKNMVKFILEGISPVEKAPAVPPEYWEKLKDTAHGRMTLAGYRIADLIISAADRITEQRKFVGR